ncbi:MAG TPA: DivIVA domain-containing protein [Tenericutes bacterium]|nr:DivIVA domain-containing protein [Mycoplasmatota bacterium]
MEKFSRSIRGYDPEEVNAFLDKVIIQVENMVQELKEKNDRISQLEIIEYEYNILKEKISHYENMEDTLNKAIIMAQRTSDQMKVTAHQESEIILEDARKNASRIVNEALIRAEKTEYEANMLRRNINIFKRRLKSIIESQLEIVDDIEKVDF